MTSLVIAIITSLTIIIGILFFPNIRIKNIKFQSFFVISLIGALLMLIFSQITFNDIYLSFSSQDSMNPIKILILFFSFTFLSISLDKLGFFSYISTIVLNKANGNQYKLFFSIYILTALLTIFTSNDIVILSFTPIICYFAKRSKINPIPYLILEFVNANTYSMLLQIGNPTNIYLSLSYGIDFMSYLKVMILPTLFAGISSMSVLLLIFRKSLNEKIDIVNLDNKEINHKNLVKINLGILIITIIALVISNYINLEIYLISFVGAITLAIILIIYTFKTKDKLLLYTVKSLPYNLIPFLLSMAIIVLSLNKNGITSNIYNLLSTNNTILEGFNYLTSSLLCTNLMNNIPMSILYSSILANPNTNLINVYSSIISSNIGAYLTPIGSMAGIMWLSILKTQDIKFSFKSFVKYGLVLVPVVIIFSYLGLIIVLH